MAGWGLLESISLGLTPRVFELLSGRGRKFRRVSLIDSLSPIVIGKDVIVALYGLFSKDKVLNHAIEVSGLAEITKRLPINTRFAVANIIREWGAFASLILIEKTLQNELA